MKPPPKTSLVALALVGLAAALRFQDLSLRPFHHDEGVNGFFLARLVREGIFNYDPSNYHGPTLYYLTLPLTAIFGISDTAVRGTTALFGTLVIFLLWRLLAPVGAMYAFGAMTLFATSPGAVFYSRYFIHEMLFVAFTVGALATSPRRDCAARWRFVATGIFLALLFATKETAFVSVGAMIGGAVVAAWAVLGLSPLALIRGIKPYAREHADSLLHGFIAFVVTAGLFYSSFFRNPVGVLDAFRTFAFWTKTAVRDHANPWHQHFLWLEEADPVLLYLGCAGLILALVLRRSFIAVMASVWLILVFFAYAVVNYKTPWLGLNMLLPLAITAGYVFHEMGALRLPGGRVSLTPVAAALLAMSAGIPLVQTQELETRNYDAETHPYIYAHTQRTFLEFVRLIEEKAKGLAGTETGIAVFAPENWPLAWYLRDYTKTGYWGDIKPEVDVDMYVASTAQDAQMAMNTGGRYDRFGPFNLRGVVDLVLYVRRKPG